MKQFDPTERDPRTKRILGAFRLIDYGIHKLEDDPNGLEDPISLSESVILVLRDGR